MLHIIIIWPVVYVSDISPAGLWGLWGYTARGTSP